MRMLLLCAALLLAVPSAGIADDTTSGSPDASAAVTDNSAAVTDNSAAVPDNSVAVPDNSAAVPDNSGVSQSAGACVQGFQTATCGGFTGCALPTWQCCPDSSNTGWQWADNSSSCPM